MAEQKKINPEGEKPEEEASEVPVSPELQKKAEGTKERLDDLMDEIDEILEENAEEFVKTYVQRGGE